MAVAGDRSVAGLLSALAEAPDYAGAASFLLAELVELAGATRACTLRILEEEGGLTEITSVGFEPDQPKIRIPLHEVSNPMVVSALSLLPARGHGSLGVAGLETVTSWTLFPRPQPTFRGAPDLMPQARAAELMRSQPATLITHRERRFASSPDGVIILDAALEGETFDEIAELIALASPILARLSAL